jgi:anti-sigma regulatory factor (Ser/Thr protein kinase)
VESRDRDLFDGIESLREAVTSLGDRRRKARELSARVADLLVPAGAADDVTLLALAKAAPRVTALRTFEGNTTAAGEARRFVEEVLSGWNCDEDVIERAKLCSSELVTNAVIHAGSATTVTVRSDGSYVLLMVHDQGSHHRVAPAHVAPDTISGRGLSLVEAMSSAWSVEQSTDGTLVWCELELDPPSNGFEGLAS